jgi:hypothetical protein
VIGHVNQLGWGTCLSRTLQRCHYKLIRSPFPVRASDDPYDGSFCLHELCSEMVP